MVHMYLSFDNWYPSLTWRHRILQSGPIEQFAMAAHCRSWPLESTTSSLIECPQILALIAVGTATIEIKSFGPFQVFVCNIASRLVE